MSGQKPESTSFLHTVPHRAEQLSAETIERFAKLLATGEVDWPAGLSDEQESELLRAVRHFRRARLVKLIASRIAAEIAAETRARAKEVQQ